MNLKGHLNINQVTIDKGQNILLDEAREGAESINDSNYIETLKLRVRLRI